jgi:hypothetical protein
VGPANEKLLKEMHIVMALCGSCPSKKKIMLQLYLRLSDVVDRNLFFI